MKNTHDTNGHSAVAKRETASHFSEPAKPFLQLFENTLKDMYWAEKHLVTVLPKMAQAASAPELRTAFDNHLKETKEQVTRLEKVFTSCGLTVGSKRCEGIEGLTTEGGEVINDYPMGNIRDAGLIIGAQKVEHYEIVAYGSLIAMANVMKCTDAIPLLRKTLEEEAHADKLLTRISETVNAKAMNESGAAQDGQHYSTKIQHERNRIHANGHEEDDEE